MSIAHGPRDKGLHYIVYRVVLFSLSSEGPDAVRRSQGNRALSVQLQCGRTAPEWHPHGTHAASVQRFA